MCTQELMKSRTFKIAALAVACFLIALVVFAAGVFVGFHKARYSYKFGENYERNFVGGPFQGGQGIMGNREPRGMMRDFEGNGFRNGHGIAGTIISISDNNIIAKDRDGKENTVAVTDKTIIKSQSNDIKISDLKQDDQIVVMGSPGDNGVINADLIRIFDNNAGNQ